MEFIDLLDHIARDLFGPVLRRDEADPPALLETAIRYRAVALEYEIVASFAGGFDNHTRISEHSLHSIRSPYDLVQELQTAVQRRWFHDRYHRMVDDELRRREQQRQVTYYQELLLRQAELAVNPPMYTAVDPAALDLTPGGITFLRAGGGGGAHHIHAVDWSEVNRADLWGGGGGGESRNLTATEVRERQRAQELFFHDQDRLRQAMAMMDLPEEWLAPRDRAAQLAAIQARRSAEKRANDLLMETLSTQQREEYRANQFFTVKGSSGGTYRIRYGSSNNIVRIDARGEEVERLCFAPRGGLAHGDSMVAQKIMLETSEPEARQVANKTGLGPRSPAVPRIWDRLRGFL